ncbi:MAG: EamA family transporter [Cyclobacteriaceae bacterium]
MSRTGFNHRVTIVLCFLAIYIIWGTTYYVIVLGLVGFPPFLMAAIRFLLAGILLAGYSLYKREPFPSKRSLIKNSIIGLVVLAGGQGSLIWAEQYIASGYASVLVATIPVWFVVIDRAHWKSYFSNPYIIAGLVIGFIGIVLLLKDKLNQPMEGESLYLAISGSAAVIFGAICWVLGTLYNRSRPAPGTMHQNLGWQLILGAISCFLISLIMGEYNDPRWFNADLNAWYAVTYLAIAGSIVAYMAYTWLLNHLPSAIVGTYAYINPVVAVFLSWMLAAEQITSMKLIGMAIVLLSAILININRSKAVD